MAPSDEYGERSERDVPAGSRPVEIGDSGSHEGGTNTAEVADPPGIARQREGALDPLDAKNDHDPTDGVDVANVGSAPEDYVDTGYQPDRAADANPGPDREYRDDTDRRP